MQKFLLIVMLLLGGCAGYMEASNDNVLPSWALGAFVRPEGVNPLVEPNSASVFDCPMADSTVHWELADTFNPAAVVKDGKIYILYRAEDNPNAGIGGRTSRIGLAESTDGTTISYRSPVPVMYPDKSEMSKTYEWNGGCEDPRVVVAEIDGKTLYVMMYTSWNHDKARLSVATSDDLLTWTHQGPAFLKAYNGKFKDLSCKSGSIVTKVIDGKQQAAKVTIDGKEKYLMYWGENAVYAAVSDDLINWEPYVDSSQSLIKIMETRKGYFDSNLTECGPPAVATDNGIVLLYNGKNNSGTGGDPCYAAGTYAAGQALFDLNNPYKLISRLDKPFFRPMTDFEKSGQYVAGTVFVEGLVFFNNKWYMYYGCADSKVGVAVYDPSSGNNIGDPIVMPVPQGVINAYPANGEGKLRCTIHSYSGSTNSDESPFYLNTSYTYANKKWCDTSTQPWVVFELMDYYKINRFVMRDVEGHETNCGNVPEYWLYVSNDGNQWTELLHKTDVGSQGVKDESFEPVETRYVKLVLKKGTRGTGVADNAVRIYGVDLYGEYSRSADHNGVVSVGKTVLKSYNQTNEREQAINMLDGNYTDKRTKWCFYKSDVNTDPYKYVVIDLENQYDISEFKMYDCKTIEPDNNIDTYQIYISKDLPDLNLITPRGDSNTCWGEPVVNKTGQSDVALKDDVLAKPVTGRYVKLVIPRTDDDMNNFTARIYAFDVLGTVSTGIKSLTDMKSTVADNRIYTVSGQYVGKNKSRLGHGIYVQNGTKIVR
jgi:predicted GH43/DUF377 family glycosyl hydrolase